MSPEVLGFVLVLSAGLCTGLGSCVVFSPRLIKLASRRFLAGSLSFSAGVMIYVSFVEILNKSTEAFGTHGAGNKVRGLTDGFVGSLPFGTIILTTLFTFILPDASAWLATLRSLVTRRLRFTALCASLEALCSCI